MSGLAQEGFLSPLLQVGCNSGLENSGGQIALQAVGAVDGVGLVRLYEGVVVVVVVVEVRGWVVHRVCQRRRACGLELGCRCNRGRTVRVVIVAGEVPRWLEHGRWSRVWPSACRQGCGKLDGQ